MNIKETTINEIYDIHSKIPEFMGPNLYDLDYINKRTAGKKTLVLLGEIEDQPAAYIVGYEEKEGDLFYSWIGGTLPEFRKSGVYKELRKYQENWAKENGYKRIQIKTLNNKIPMRIILAKMGYNIVGFEKKDNVEENRLMHEKIL